MKIGIMGGTFDPIHNGHLMLGRYARDLFDLDEIWVMPNGTPPHKKKSSIESDTVHRVEMVRRAIRAEEHFVLQMYEVDNKEVNYSYKTMEHFKEIYPEHLFYFIIGADSLFSLEGWVEPARLLKTCVVLAAYRDGKCAAEMETQIAYLNQKFDADIRLLSTPNVDIASRDIRRQLQLGISVEDDIPEAVLDYIKENDLYPFELSELCEKIKSQQKEKRFLHTEGVMKTAFKLSERYGANSKKAVLAAILHDLAKNYSISEQLRKCNDYGVELSVSEQENPALIHAKLGAYSAKKEYGIDDREVLDAICYHTTGRPNMTLLDKIIYIADYIEPNRNQAPNLEKLRILAFQDLEQCLLQILEATLSYLKSENKAIDSMTEETYEYYKNKLQ